MHRCCMGLRWRSALLSLVLGGVAWPALAQVQKFPDVVGVRVQARSAGVLDFDVTVSSPYDTPQRYADGFRAMSEDGRTVFGMRPLGHDHAGEQPFTRDLHGVVIPAGVRRVSIQARDQRHGWGGKSRIVALPDR
jgi:hypothetical protein